jgi:hypothetical protein
MVSVGGSADRWRVSIYATKPRKKYIWADVNGREKDLHHRDGQEIYYGSILTKKKEEKIMNESNEARELVVRDNGIPANHDEYSDGCCGVSKEIVMRTAVNMRQEIRQNRRLASYRHAHGMCLSAEKSRRLKAAFGAIGEEVKKNLDGVLIAKQKDLSATMKRLGRPGRLREKGNGSDQSHEQSASGVRPRCRDD